MKIISEQTAVMPYELAYPQKDEDKGYLSKVWTLISKTEIRCSEDTPDEQLNEEAYRLLNLISRVIHQKIDEHEYGCSISLNEYQSRAMSTCLPSCANFGYMATGLIGEVGEFFGKMAKHFRKENAVIEGNMLVTERGHKLISEEEMHDLKSEAGDILWFVAGLCADFGWTLQEVAQENLDKLASRKQRGVIDGDGDRR